MPYPDIFDPYGSADIISQTIANLGLNPGGGYVGQPIKPDWYSVYSPETYGLQSNLINAANNLANTDRVNLATPNMVDYSQRMAQLSAANPTLGQDAISRLSGLGASPLIDESSGLVRSARGISPELMSRIGSLASNPDLVGGADLARARTAAGGVPTGLLGPETTGANTLTGFAGGGIGNQAVGAYTQGQRGVFNQLLGDLFNKIGEQDVARMGPLGTAPAGQDRPGLAAVKARTGERALTDFMGQIGQQNLALTEGNLGRQLQAAEATPAFGSAMFNRSTFAPNFYSQLAGLSSQNAINAAGLGLRAGEIPFNQQLAQAQALGNNAGLGFQQNLAGNQAYLNALMQRSGQSADMARAGFGTEQSFLQDVMRAPTYGADVLRSLAGTLRNPQFAPSPYLQQQTASGGQTGGGAGSTGGGTGGGGGYNPFGQNTQYIPITTPDGRTVWIDNSGNIRGTGLSQNDPTRPGLPGTSTDVSETGQFVDANGNPITTNTSIPGLGSVPGLGSNVPPWYQLPPPPGISGTATPGGYPLQSGGTDNLIWDPELGYVDSSTGQVYGGGMEPPPPTLDPVSGVYMDWKGNPVQAPAGRVVDVDPVTGLWREIASVPQETQGIPTGATMNTLSSGLQGQSPSTLGNQTTGAGFAGGAGGAAAGQRPSGSASGGPMAPPPSPDQVAAAQQFGVDPSQVFYNGITHQWEVNNSANPNVGYYQTDANGNQQYVNAPIPNTGHPIDGGVPTNIGPGQGLPSIQHDPNAPPSINGNNLDANGYPIWNGDIHSYTPEQLAYMFGGGGGSTGTGGGGGNALPSQNTNVSGNGLLQINGPGNGSPLDALGPLGGWFGGVDSGASAGQNVSDNRIGDIPQPGGGPFPFTRPEVQGTKPGMMEYGIRSGINQGMGGALPSASGGGAPSGGGALPSSGGSNQFTWNQQTGQYEPYTPPYQPNNALPNGTYVKPTGWDTWTQQQRQQYAVGKYGPAGQYQFMAWANGALDQPTGVSADPTSGNYDPNYVPGGPAVGSGGTSAVDPRIAEFSANWAASHPDLSQSGLALPGGPGALPSASGGGGSFPLGAYDGNQALPANFTDRVNDRFNNRARYGTPGGVLPSASGGGGILPPSTVSPGIGMSQPSQSGLHLDSASGVYMDAQGTPVGVNNAQVYADAGGAWHEGTAPTAAPSQSYDPNALMYETQRMGGATGPVMSPQQAAAMRQNGETGYDPFGGMGGVTQDPNQYLSNLQMMANDPARYDQFHPDANQSALLQRGALEGLPTYNTGDSMFVPGSPDYQTNISHGGGGVFYDQAGNVAGQMNVPHPSYTNGGNQFTWNQQTGQYDTASMGSAQPPQMPASSMAPSPVPQALPSPAGQFGGPRAPQPPQQFGGQFGGQQQAPAPVAPQQRSTMAQQFGGQFGARPQGNPFGGGMGMQRRRPMNFGQQPTPFGGQRPAPRPPMTAMGGM